jgi:hypothetical protein
MGKGDTTENDVLKCVLVGTDPAWRSNATLYVALHTSDPGESGVQTTNETAFTNYARQPITKATGWTDGGSSFTNADLIQFPVCGASGATVTHVSIGTVLSAGGQILYSGELSAPLAVALNIQPQFAIGAITITEA